MSATGHIDFARVKELGYTNDLREAGYITPEGKLIDLSGKREGGTAGKRSYDHREVGGTSGMQEFEALGNIRMDYSDSIAVLDIAKLPTGKQERAITKLLEYTNGNVNLDLADGLGQWSEGEDRYLSPRTSFVESDGGKPARILGLIHKFYEGENVSGAVMGSMFRLGGVLDISRNPGPTRFNAAFKKWFGRSRVVDENGEPLVVYHGTDADFTEFRLTNEIGYHFGTEEAANERIKQVWGYKHPGVVIMPCYLSLQNPLRVADQGTWESAEVALELWDKGVIGEEQFEVYKHELDQEDLVKLLAAKGYDGLCYYNLVEHKGGRRVSARGPRFKPVPDSWIALHPSQIKSVFNTGTWSREDPDIRRNPDDLPFFSTCVNWPEDLMPALMFLTENGKNISRRWFLRMIDRMEMTDWEIKLGYAQEQERGLHMDKDRMVSYEHLPGWDVAWFSWSSIEHVFATPETIEKLNEFAKERGL